jgi:RNA polymerase sigma-32 factor
MMYSNLSPNLVSSAGSLETYISSVNKIPMLTLAEEQTLAFQLMDEGNVEAARKLVLAHLKFVVKITRQYNGYGLAQNDLIQEGNIGLMQAVKKFDPRVGTRLAAFAAHWIKASISEFILKNWRIVKMATTKAQRKLFFNLRSLKKSLSWLSTAEKAEIASDLDVEENDVAGMELRLSASDLPFGSTTETDEDFSPESFIEDMRFEPSTGIEKNERAHLGKQCLGKALMCLDERSRDIVVSRWLRDPKNTLRELAIRYSVSAERVRQLEKNAFMAIKKSLPKPEDLIL